MPQRSQNREILKDVPPEIPASLPLLPPPEPRPASLPTPASEPGLCVEIDSQEEDSTQQFAADIFQAAVAASSHSDGYDATVEDTQPDSCW
eukprot:3856959-Pyramimonas_sp.AAC.1